MNQVLQAGQTIEHCCFLFLAATSDIMAVQLKLMQLNILILQTIVDDRETCFTFTSFSTIYSNSSASEHEFADLLYVTKFSKVWIPDSTIVSLPQKYSFKAGFTDTNLSLSLVSFSNLFNTDKFNLTKF